MITFSVEKVPKKEKKTVEKVLKKEKKYRKVINTY